MCLLAATNNHGIDHSSDGIGNNHGNGIGHSLRDSTADSIIDVTDSWYSTPNTLDRLVV